MTDRAALLATPTPATDDLSLADRITHYDPPPTASAFLSDDSFVRGIMGPIGSGKSTACCMEIMHRAASQTPGSDGVRRTRWAVIRATYPELRSTTIKTWTYCFPSHVCRMVYSPLIVGRVQTALPDSTSIDAEVIFLALNNPGDVDKLLSLELTGAWINEAREVDKPVLDMLTGRVGRFPPKKPIGCTWRGIFMDTNPPHNLHWYYKMAEEIRPKGWTFYQQPPALIPRDGVYYPNPNAENIENLDENYGYYYRQIPGKDAEWIKVYIIGQYGSIFEGRPVYEGLYRDSYHVSKEPLQPFGGLPLVIGFDFGMTPAAVFTQLSPNGQLLILREFQCEYGGLRPFVETVVRPALVNEFPSNILQIWCDPSGVSKSQVDETSCIAELNRLGLRAEPAPSNDISIRRNAVIKFLTRNVGGAPGLLIDPSCATLRLGFQGGYKFRRIMARSDTVRYTDLPVKDMYSHLHDALAYACLGIDHDRESSVRRGSFTPTRRSWAGAV